MSARTVTPLPEGCQLAGTNERWCVAHGTSLRHCVEKEVLRDQIDVLRARVVVAEEDSDRLAAAVDRMRKAGRFVTPAVNLCMADHFRAVESRPKAPQ